jgi:hypothetical protein
LTTYKWNEDSRLQAAFPLGTAVTMNYSGDGKRVKKTVGGTAKQFVYDNEKVLHEADGGRALRPPPER